MSSALNPPMPGKNKYVVWNSELNVFDEFPIKLGEVIEGNFLEIIIAPPVRREGFLSYKKQLFYLSIHDLLRNHVNVRKPYITTAIATNTGSPTDVEKQPISVTDQSRPRTSAGDELDKESCLYWQEQIESLLNTED